MISVVIPSYNQQAYLADAIESVLDQNVQGQLIVVDDGSTDNSLAIAQKYQTARPDVVQVIAQVNKGLASARNTGLMHAKSDWCLFLDADDMLLEGSLERLQVAIDNTDAEIIAPSLKTFGSSNQEVLLMKDPKLADFRTGNKVGYCAVIKKSALLEVGGYSPRMVEGYEDLHLWCDLLSRGKKIVTIPEVLWFYRTKDESMWTKITPDIHLKLLNQINKDVPSAQLNFPR